MNEITAIDLEAGKQSTRPRFLIFIFVIAAASTLWALIAGIANPPLDQYEFRQTQTALSVYWLIHGGPWINYETPVLGAPWSIPFEFPVYQLVVAAIAHLGVPLNVAGRLVNFFFYIATLLPLGMLARSTAIGVRSFWIVATLFLSSPLYSYWSRTFMIESSALFFNLLWLACLAEFLRNPKWKWCGAAIFSGCLGILAKSTTFPAYGFLGGIASAIVLYRNWNGSVCRKRVALKAGAVAAIGGLPLLVGLLWVHHTDAVKSGNVFGNMLTATALTDWLYGTLAQRLDLHQWKAALISRTLPQALGYAWPLGLILICVGLIKKGHIRLWIAASVVGFLLPFFLFTNLLFVHAYYPYDCAVMLLIATGITIEKLFSSKLKTLETGILLTIVLGQIAYFYHGFYRFIGNDYSNNEYYQVGEIIKNNTPVNSAIVIYGTDWSSVVPYQSERKALAVANWFPDPLFEQTLSEPQSFLGDIPLSAIIVCTDGLSGYPIIRQHKIETAIEARPILGTAGSCQVFSSSKIPKANER